MTAKKSFSFKLSVAAVVFLTAMVVISSVLITGQPALRRSPHHVGVVNDWSFHHLVYSNPGTYDQVKNHPAALSRLMHVQYDTRYIMQQMKRSGRPAASSGVSASKIPALKLIGNPTLFDVAIFPAAKRPLRPTLKKDWSAPLLTGAVLPNMFPATYADSPSSPSCTSDYAVYPTGSVGAAGAATIIAYNNLYATTCSTGAVPSVYWAYNTGTGYTVTTSPVISLDGTEVAFIQTKSTATQLVVVKFTAGGGTVSSPAAAPTTSLTGMNCTAPCMTVTNISTTIGDTYSSPFYDYSTDSLYVGDNSSHLYNVTGGVFNGTGALTVASVSLNGTAYKVASPVYDSVSGCVFVGDTQGYLYSVSSGVAGTVCTGASFAKFATSALLGGGAAAQGIFDGPLVDSAAGTVYAFVAGSAAFTVTATIKCITAGHNCVDQFSTGFTGATAAPSGNQDLGIGGANYNLYSGNFDNVYFSSSAPPTGYLYVIGNTGVASGNAGKLYQVKITSNVMGTPAQTPSGASYVNNGQPVWASPVTEFFNANTGVDYIFASAFRGLESSAGTWGSGTDCYTGTGAQGCVFAINVTNPAAVTASSGMLITNSADATSGNAGCWGTSGIVVDNSFSNTGTSNVYFVNLNGNFPAAAVAPPCKSAGTPTTATIQAVQGAQSAL